MFVFFWDILKFNLIIVLCLKVRILRFIFGLDVVFFDLENFNLKR